MANRRSLVQRCLTPMTVLPRSTMVVVGVVMWALFFLIWVGLSNGGVVPPMFLPTPTAVLHTGWELLQNGTLPMHIWASARVVLTGFILSSLLAIPLGLLMGTFPVVQAMLEPIVNFIRYLPVTAFVPLFILWIGIGEEQRVAVILFGTFFQQLIMFSDVARQVPRDLLNAAYTLGATRASVTWQVLAPASLPGVLDALRVTMGWAWTYLVVAELVAASSGLGYISLKAMRGFQVDVIFLAIAIIGALGLVTDQAFRFLRLKVAGWAQ
ncbi:ABC transporter permease [Insolitispirillum peregrinum]|uniref:ABC transporter permease n=1 Tax=Insolitispirillum peregrinum TaxID=80876 RepID=UPI003622C894